MPDAIKAGAPPLYVLETQTMTACVHFFPLGNADTLRLDLADGRKVLVNYAAMRSDDDDEDKRCDRPAELHQDLKKAGRDFFDAVCITHTHSDHCKGFGGILLV